MAKYAPIVLSVRMSDYGYWIADVSVAPDKTMSMMIAQVGISPGQAAQLSLVHLPDTDRSIPI